MKALTLTQPWASLMDLRQKQIETRSWYTAYRGELVIHAAKNFPLKERLLASEPNFQSALGGALANNLPCSRGLCVVRLLACIPTSQMHRAEAVFGQKPNARELLFGNFEHGRYAWLTEYVRHLDDTREVRGALGLWEWPGKRPTL